MAETRDFLLEIGTEEMPSAPLMNAAGQLGRLVAKGLDEAGLAHGEVRVISSPRRLAALVAGVPGQTDEVHEVRRGPAASIAFDDAGAPTKAAQGFARKCGVAADELVRRVDADGREYVFAERSVPAAPALPILSELSERVIGSLEWPNYRSQRWGCEHQTFVRPIRWICALLGGEVVPVRYADVTSSNVTRGHRVLSPGDHVVDDASRYEEVLEAAHVLSAERRAERIRAGIAEVEAARGGAHVDTPKRIFDEVVNLCEWPTVLVGTFDEEFLRVPPRDHLRVDALQPALLPDLRRRRRAHARVRRGLQRRPGRLRDGRGGQRARGARPPRRRQVLLRGGPQAAARGLRRAPRGGHLPGEPGHHAPEGRAHGGARPRRGRAGGRRRGPPLRSPSGRPTSPRPTS